MLNTGPSWGTLVRTNTELPRALGTVNFGLITNELIACGASSLWLPRTSAAAALFRDDDIARGLIPSFDHCPVFLAFISKYCIAFKRPITMHRQSSNYIDHFLKTRTGVDKTDAIPSQYYDDRGPDVTIMELGDV